MSLEFVLSAGKIAVQEVIRTPMMASYRTVVETTAEEFAEIVESHRERKRLEAEGRLLFRLKLERQLAALADYDERRERANRPPPGWRAD